MKKLLLLLMPVVLFACTDYSDDLDAVNDRLDKLENQVDNLKNGGGDNNGGNGVDIPADKTQAISFVDSTTKLICILQWDTNEDDELSYEEAAAVTDLGLTFRDSAIMAFAELKYFTGLTNIAGGAFNDCKSLVKITLPEQITSIGANAFYNCSHLKKITIPDSVTSIGNSAFRYCSSLTSVTIPDSVTSIGSYAFYECSSLTSVTIPDSVTSIGDFVFYYCSSLTSVYCKPTTPPAGSTYMFSNNASGRKIYVPRNSVEAYKSTSYWSDYADYIEGYDF